MNQTWENGNKPDFRPNLGQFDPMLGLEKWWKTSFWVWSTPVGPKFQSPIHFLFLFSKNLAKSVNIFRGKLSLCTISEKINDPILGKFSEGRTDRQTGRRTDGREWFYRNLSDVECPKIVLLFFMIWFDRMIWGYIEKWEKC